MQAINWAIPRTALAVGAQDVHLWRAQLPEGLTSGAMSRFGQAVLRDVLSWYLPAGQAPRIARSAFGKPYLVGGNGLAFNVSHSAEFLLIGLTGSSTIGVDIEQIDPRFAYQPVAQRHFSRREQSALRQADNANRRQLFYKGWTGKEAVVKGIGQGVSLPLRSMEIDGVRALLRGRPSDWSIHSLRPAPSYMAAYAVRGSDHQRQFWQWSANLTRPRQ